jgi:2,3-bisphosphoglycerate-dependent phosphoglycerate mutase
VTTSVPSSQDVPRPERLDHTELVLARHGEGVCNAAGLIGGERGCTGLTDHGREQSARNARCILQMHRQRPFDLLCCSPRQRVRQSAEPIAATLGLPVTVLDALRGQDFGAADGQSWLRVTRAFGGPPDWDPDRPIAAGAEPWNAYAERVLAALARLLVDQAGRRLLVVGHGKTVGLTGALLSGAADPARAAPEHVVDHGGLVHWRMVRDAGTGPLRWDRTIPDLGGAPILTERQPAAAIGS